VARVAEEDLQVSLKKNLEDNLKPIQEELGVGVSFDVLVRRFKLGRKDAALVFIDGFVKDDIIQRLLQFLMTLEGREIGPNIVEKLLNRYITYLEVNRADTLKQVIDEVLAGPLALLVDGASEAVIIDARTYPARGPDEPDLERVSRGSRDGFVETIVFNTALVRRRVRDPSLRIELKQVGRRSKTDVAVVYLKDIANPELVEEVKTRIKKVDVDGLPMAEKSLEEYILEQKKWWNPFPTVRYTERPDVVAVHLFEGHVAVIVDTSPSVMLLPATLFHFIQHAEEYRQDVLVGTFLRLIRTLGVLFSWLLSPLWLLFALHPELLPPALKFIGPEQVGEVGLGVQFILAEVSLTIFRMALVHTPNALSTSLGIIGAILLGEMAVKVGLFNPETVMYVAVAAIGTFATPSMELGMALRLFRFLGVVGVALAGLTGFIVVYGVSVILLLVTRSFNVPYLWPLVPLNAKALAGVIFRGPVPERRRRPAALRPRDPDPHQ